MRSWPEEHGASPHRLCSVVAAPALIGAISVALMGCGRAFSPGTASPHEAPLARASPEAIFGVLWRSSCKRFGFWSLRRLLRRKAGHAEVGKAISCVDAPRLLLSGCARGRAIL